MPLKSFLVKVELSVQKVSCPGVWLCSNGKVSLQLCMLDSTIQTDSYKPVFPVVFNEKFIFYKTFLKEKRLNELQRSLGRQWLCVELIQWKNCDEGVVLASFQTTLDDLLYPNLKASNISGTDVDLLMEPTKLFPGTLSPKLELKTKTTIEETLSDLKQRHSDKILHSNPVKTSCSNQNSHRKLHPKKVCHTVAYSKAQQRSPNIKKDKRPIFKYKKPEDDLILRLNPDKVLKEDFVRPNDRGDEILECKSKKDSWCYCEEAVPISSQEKVGLSCVKNIKETHQSQESNPCLCCSQHQPSLCPICSKYECTFSLATSRHSREFLGDSYQNSCPNLCSYCRINYGRSKSKGKSEGWTSPSERKVCFCLPEENVSSLARRLHERVRNTVQYGAESIENCFRDCEVCE